MSNLIDDIRKVEVAGKLRLLHETACEGYDENALLDQARDTIAIELAAKDAEIARLREECDEYVAEMARLNFKAIEYREALGPFAALDGMAAWDVGDQWLGEWASNAAKALGEDR